MLRRVKKLCLVGILALAFALPVPASGGSSAATIKSTNLNDWSPYKTVITKGDKVTWEVPQRDGHHDLKGYKYEGNADVSDRWLRLTEIHGGDSFTKRFRKPGRYYFQCAIHSTITQGECGGMCGFIKVRR